MLAHLIGKLYDESCASTVDVHQKKARLLASVRSALERVIGTYGIALLHADVPDFINRGGRWRPAFLGGGEGGNFLGRDGGGVGGYTRERVYLNEFDFVAVGREEFEISSLGGV